MLLAGIEKVGRSADVDREGLFWLFYRAGHRNLCSKMNHGVAAFNRSLNDGLVSNITDDYLGPLAGEPVGLCCKAG